MENTPEEKKEESTKPANKWPDWTRCIRSYTRDFMIANSDLVRERKEYPGVPPMRLKAFNGCAAILQRRVKLSAARNPIIRLYKCVDTESEQDMYDNTVLPQQADDKMKCIVTCTDLTLESTMTEQFSDDETRFNVFIVEVRALLEDGWTPMYDRGRIYWYPPITINYLYGAPEFSTDHIGEQCINY